jgi:hypothetical protein
LAQGLLDEAIRAQLALDAAETAEVIYQNGLSRKSSVVEQPGYYCL